MTNSVKNNVFIYPITPVLPPPYGPLSHVAPGEPSPLVPFFKQHIDKPVSN